MRLHLIRSYLFPGLLLFVTGCATIVEAPVSNREKQPQTTTKPPVAADIKLQTQIMDKNSSRPGAGYHIVVKGDTLYSIAWRYDHDYRDIANWNEIISPYVIYPGQLIRLKPVPWKKKKPPEAEPAPRKTEVKKAKKIATAPKQTLKPAKKTSLSAGPIKWRWPTSGKLLKSDTPTSKKGIDITGKIGQQVKAAADGNVVYSGSGLLGYGRLIIIKHNDTYLSAYAYNSKLLVKEGDKVITGQKIATMGQGNNGRAMLHFEIRKDGKPTNPLKILPAKRT
ncbi:MAG: peptidoglycan DD-metalloendopeptidase family protein [Gammaproteobacteria bacterium]